MNTVFVSAFIVAALLGIASAAEAILRARGRSSDELYQRIRSWWIMAAIFFALILSGPTGALWLFGILSYLALKEYFTMIPIRQVDRRIIFWSYLSIPFQYWWIADGWYGMVLIWIPVYLFLLLPLRQVLTGETRGFLRSTGTVHWGLMLFVYALSHLALLYTLPDREGIGGPELLIFLVILTELGDIYQYLFGKTFGRRKILPKVSPGKTVEGLLGSLIATALSAWGLSWLTPFDLPTALLAGLLISAAGFVGDVVVSMVKRDVGVKDTGTLIPGHGGIMDRIDSLTYTAPLFFHAVYYLYY